MTNADTVAKVDLTPGQQLDSTLAACGPLCDVEAGPALKGSGAAKDPAAARIDVPLSHWHRENGCLVRVDAQVRAELDREFAPSASYVETLTVHLVQFDWDDADHKSSTLRLELWQAADLRNALDLALRELSSRGLRSFTEPAADQVRTAPSAGTADTTADPT
mgnify:CR=1 FL=1